MTYALFIDDERFPAAERSKAGYLWVIARTLEETRDILRERGAPAFVSFDHDLGDNIPSGLDIAKAMVAADLIAQMGPAGDETDDLACGFDDIGFRFPENFSYTIHSMNSVGGPNIDALLKRYLESK